jgi:hypothetical protein
LCPGNLSDKRSVREVCAGRGERKAQRKIPRGKRSAILGEEGFGEEISRDVEEISKPKRKKPIETVLKGSGRREEGPPELLRSKDRRWDISRKRAEAVAILVREYGYGVSEVAKYLGRDQANVSTMLSRLSVITILLPVCRAGGAQSEGGAAQGGAPAIDPLQEGINALKGLFGR